MFELATTETLDPEDFTPPVARRGVFPRCAAPLRRIRHSIQSRHPSLPATAMESAALQLRLVFEECLLGVCIGHPGAVQMQGLGAGLKQGPVRGQRGGLD